MLNPILRFRISRLAAGSTPRLEKVSLTRSTNLEIELGYAPNNIYLNTEDQLKIQAMNDMERELLLDERNQKVEAARFKYERQRQ